MKTVIKWLGAIMLASGLFALGAFGDYYSDTVGTGFDSNYDSGTFYNVPEGANAEWSASLDGGSYASTALWGGGLNVNQELTSDGFYDNIGNTTSADNVGYAIEALGGYSDAYVAVYW